MHRRTDGFHCQLGSTSNPALQQPDRPARQHTSIEARTHIFLTASVRGISLWPTTRASCGDTRITALRPDILPPSLLGLLRVAVAATVAGCDLLVPLLLFCVCECRGGRGGAGQSVGVCGRRG